MANNFKNVVDINIWRQVTPAPGAHAAGMGIASDLRNDLSRNPHVYQLLSATVLNRYNIVTKGWGFVVSPALAGTFGAGSGCVFAPSMGLVGVISGGNTTSAVVLSTPLPTAVAPNMLANRGGSGEYGFRARIIGSSAGGSGKVEERWIVGNSGGATPKLNLDTPLSFVPQSGDTYEILAGRVFMLGAGALAAGSWKSYEVATNTLASKSQTNLPATIATDFASVALDEQYVPYDNVPGEGFVVGAGTYDGGSKRCLTATAIAANTITGQVSAGDASVVANEYRNFQIRIVEDATTPTAVGQRRVIASHTAGASPVYTLGSSWTVNPSATSKFVIEYPNLIILRTSAQMGTYTYNYGAAAINNGTNTIATDAWSTTYFAAIGSAHAAGCMMFPSFGIKPDAGKNARHSYLYHFRGGATTLDLFDIAGGTAGTWTLGISYDGNGMMTPGAGSCGCSATVGNEGRATYINGYTASQLSQIFRFDVKNRVLSPYTPTDWIQSGTATVGDRLAAFVAVDGADKYDVVLMMSHLSAISQELVAVI
jgi:hypothetical protein